MGRSTFEKLRVVGCIYTTMTTNIIGRCTRSVAPIVSKAIRMDITYLVLRRRHTLVLGSKRSEMRSNGVFDTWIVVGGCSGWRRSVTVR